LAGTAALSGVQVEPCGIIALDLLSGKVWSTDPDGYRIEPGER
jgi:hypothetical protein